MVKIQVLGLADITFFDTANYLKLILMKDRRKINDNIFGLLYWWLKYRWQQIFYFYKTVVIFATLPKK